MGIQLGAKSRREMVLEYLATKGHDDVISFEELAQVLGLPNADGENRVIIYGAVHAASPDLANDHRKVLAAVRGVGYRIIRPEEHVLHAADQQRTAGKLVARAKLTVDTVDLSALGEAERKLAMAAAAVLAHQQEEMRRMDLRAHRMALVLDAVTTKVTEVEQATDDHGERLQRLEEQLRQLAAERAAVPAQQ